VAKVSNEELKERDNRDRKKFSGNKMEVKTSYVADKGLNLRPFQVDGVNWLAHQWWIRKPAILADEMGLVRIYARNLHTATDSCAFLGQDYSDHHFPRQTS
jgi:hypothetical protein